VPNKYIVSDSKERALREAYVEKQLEWLKSIELPRICTIPGCEAKLGTRGVASK